MTCKTIALCFTDVESAETLSRAGAALARRQDAHLIGLHVMPDPMVYPSASIYLTGDVLAGIKSGQQEISAEIEKVFRANTAREGLSVEWRSLEARLLTVSERLVESARAADIIMISRPESDLRGHVHEELIRLAGRPVLMIPMGHEATEFGTSAIVGWSATREATRAAHDARILLDKGANVVVLSVGKEAGGDGYDYPANEMAAMFSRHGMAATVTHRSQGDHKISEILEREAFETGAQFIATGAFGHSRAFDFVLGAVSRDLLRGAKRPVLFSK